jgi:tetratricopeptide (TPR) repeat protein
MAAEMSNYPSTYDRLRELLHERLALHIAKQQQALFWQGEKARRRRDYTEAKKLWQELQQQNSNFVTTNFASGKKIPIARYLELLVIEQAKRAERSGDWQQAQTLWQEVKGTWPSNRQAPGRLKNATLNLCYVPIYQQAEQYVAQKQIGQARPLLEEVWKNAPRFGDPAKLAKPTGLYSPLLSVDVVFNICLVGGLGVFVSLLDQAFLHGGLLLSQLWGLLASLFVASIVIFRMFNVRKGRYAQYGAIVIGGCIITVVATLLVIQH